MINNKHWDIAPLSMIFECTEMAALGITRILICGDTIEEAIRKETDSRYNNHGEHAIVRRIINETIGSITEAATECPLFLKYDFAIASLIIQKYLTLAVVDRSTFPPKTSSVDENSVSEQIRRIYEMLSAIRSYANSGCDNPLGCDCNPEGIREFADLIQEDLTIVLNRQCVSNKSYDKITET